MLYIASNKVHTNYNATNAFLNVPNVTLELIVSHHINTTLLTLFCMETGPRRITSKELVILVSDTPVWTCFTTMHKLKMRWLNTHVLIADVVTSKITITSSWLEVIFAVLNLCIIDIWTHSIVVWSGNVVCGIFCVIEVCSVGNKVFVCVVVLEMITYLCI